MPGGTPPHHRLLYVRRGQTLWATHGFTKKTNQTPSSEIEKAQQIHSEWRARKGE